MRSPGTPSAAICIMGPTAAGKSALALALCERMDCEIISVDSAQVYRGMDIGTAKPDLATQRRIPHHLIDICDPAESYSAARFLRDAGDAVDKVLAHGRTPLLVGGTMLYFRALRQGLSELPAADPAVRAGITALAGREGWAAVHARLAEIDPETAARIHPRNRQRTQRALEVCLVSGQPMSRLLGSNTPERGRPLRLLQLAVGPRERSTLWRLIERRFDAMLEQGFVDEVRVLHARGDLDPSLPSIRSVGYRQIWHFLEGGWSYADMRERAIIATRQLAKRQMTWLRSWPRLHWLQGEDAAAQGCDQALKLASDVSMWEVVGAES